MSNNSKMKIGYILEVNKPGERWKLKEAPCTRVINSRGDKIHSKMLLYPSYYEDVEFTTREMKKENGIIYVKEPFFIDDELRTHVLQWIEWANKVDPSEYDPFCKKRESI